MAKAIQRIEVNGVELHYQVHGAGWRKPALVFVHGGLLRSTGDLYAELLDLLGRRFAVYALDLRGHGASTSAIAEWSLATVADDVASFARKLRLKRPALVGHSLGAFTSLYSAIRNPGTFSAICVLAPGPADPRHDPVDALNFLIANKGNRDTIREGFRQMFIRQPGQSLELAVDAVARMDVSVLHALRDENARTTIEDQLKDIDAPVLLVCGERDNVIAPARQHDIARRLKRCKEVVFSTEGHMFPNEHAALAAREVINFLQNDQKLMTGS